MLAGDRSGGGLGGGEESGRLVHRNVGRRGRCIRTLAKVRVKELAKEPLSLLSEPRSSLLLAQRCRLLGEPRLVAVILIVIV